MEKLSTITGKGRPEALCPRSDLKAAPVLPRTSPDKSSGNPTGAKNSGKTREKINGRTTEQTEDRPGRLSASGPVFYPFYNRLIY
jgi:hypothetical protein